MKILIINNLASGQYDTAIYDFIRSAARDGDEICLRNTDGTTPISALIDDARTFDRVVAAGDDGTVACVMYALRYSGIPVLPFPSGTANLLSMNLQNPEEPHALAALLRDGRILDFDMGEISTENDSRGFAIMAGSGYDATLMATAAPGKHALGSMAYFLAASVNLLPQRSDIKLTIDGVSYETKGIGIVLVNFSKITAELSITHVNQPRDGMLDVVVLKAKSAFDLLPSIFAALLDVDGKFPDRGDALDIYSGREITVEADPAFLIEHDGEPTELSTPYTVRVLPAASRLVVSDDAVKLFE